MNSISRLFAALVGLSMVWGCQTTKTQSTNSSLNENDQRIIQQILIKADKREYDRVLFEAMANHASTDVRRQAVIALGRIGGGESAQTIQRFLFDGDASVRKQAAMALGIAGEQSFERALIELLEKEKQAAVKREALIAIGNLGGPQSFTVLHRFLKDAEMQGAAAQGLGLLVTWHRSFRESISASLIHQLLSNVSTANSKASDNDIGLQSAFALSRMIGPERLFGEKKFLHTINKTEHAPTVAILLRAWSKQISKTNREAFRSSTRSLLPYLNHADTNVVVEAVRVFAKYSDDKSIAELLYVLKEHAHPHVRTEALSALLNLGPYKLQAQVIEWIKSNPSPALTVKAMEFVAAQQFHDLKSWMNSLNSQTPLYVLVKSIQLAKEEAPEQWQHWFDGFHQHENDYVRQLLTSNRASPDPDEPKKYPAKATPKDMSFDLLAQSRILVETTGGEFTMKLYSDAPMTSWHFLSLVKEGYYDGSIFARVIPSFVAQGGEHHGDGTGSYGQTIREEISTRSHRTKTVGIATLGKDTGQSQFFINLAPNLHLDRRYTLFAEVVEGWQVAQQLQLGDQVIRMSIIRK